MRPSVRAEKYIRDANGWRKNVTDGNDNGTDGQTDRQTDRQSATQYAAPSYGGGPHNNNSIYIAQIRACPNRKAFSLDLNVSNDMSDNRKSFGRLFHTEGPWTEKLRSP